MIVWTRERVRARGRGAVGAAVMQVDGRTTVTHVLEPRDRVSAGRTLGIAGAVAAVVTISFETAAVVAGRVGSSSTTLLVACVLGTVMAGAGLAFWSVPHRMPRLAWTGIALFGIAVVLWVGLGTLDASAAGQIGLIYPVVYAGAHLRSLLAWTVAGLAVLADAVIVLTLLPLPVALADLFVVGAAIAMLTLVLVAAGHHQDALTRRLAALAVTDPLTGLSTRRVLDDAMHRLTRSRRGRPGQAVRPGVGLLLVDVDRFGVLNQLYGHPIGDAALVHVGAVITAAVPPRGTVARMGGDEIAVLLPDCSREEARTTAAAVLAAVHGSPLAADHGGIPLSVSIGMAHSGSGAPELAALYAAADAALYRAKAQGRGRVVVS